MRAYRRVLHVSRPDTGLSVRTTPRGVWHAGSLTKSTRPWLDLHDTRSNMTGTHHPPLLPRQPTENLHPWTACRSYCVRLDTPHNSNLLELEARIHASPLSQGPLTGTKHPR